MGKPEGGLTKWFKEDWRDVKTGKKCGRSGKEKKTRPYPACRPKKVASRISKQEAKKKSGGSKPKNPALYARVKAEAKRKFKVYPSAYANAWLVRTYKKRGGTY